MHKKHLLFGSLIVLIITGGLLLVFTNRHPAEPGVPSAQRRTSNPEVLTQCKSDLQASVFKPGTNLDLTKLGISSCYELSLWIDPALPSFQASGQITFNNATDQELSDLVFRLYPNSPLIYGGSLEIISAQINRKQVEVTYFHNNTAMRIMVPTPIKPDETVRIAIEYKIILPEDFGSSHVYGVFNHATREQIYALANWFPILAFRENNQWSVYPVDGIGDAVTSETALFLVDVTAPDAWEVVTTGIERDSESKSGFITHHFISGPARDFMIVAGPNIENISREVNSIKINQWGLAETRSGWDRALDVASSSITTFSSLYGQYPFREIDVIAVPLNIAIGVEYPGLILITQNDYQPGNDTANELTVVIAHEVAHQWWYSIVGNDVSAHPWQDEGLTTFSTLEFLKDYNPGISTYLINSYQLKVDNYQRINGIEPFTQPVSAFTSKPSAYSTLVYGKAALFFIALQKKVGEKAFNTALEAYFEENAYQIASPEHLLEAFSSACKCDLLPFFNSWGIEQ